MQHGEVPPLRAALDRRGPRIGASGFRVVVEIEDVNNAFPNGLVFESFFYGHSPYKHGCSAVLMLDSLF